MEKGVVTAVCGKGGVGKTVVTGALVRTMAESGMRILAVDADPAMGLSFILGLQPNIKTLGNIRSELIESARNKKDPATIADTLDYLVLEALIETQQFDFFAMGRSSSRGCFCPVNTLLKGSLKRLTANYDCVLVDAEAGLEQINREVMAGVSNIVTLIDGSQRSMHSLELIREITSQMKMTARVGAVLNRWRQQDNTAVLERVAMTGLPLWGTVPEDEILRNNDALGKPIFDLAPESPVCKSAQQIAHALFQN